MKIETSKQTEIKRKILIQIKLNILSFIGTSFDRKIENSVLAKLFFFFGYTWNELQIVDILIDYC